MLQLKAGTGVFTPDGRRVGDIDRIVLDPTTDEVTHVIIKKGWLLPEDKVLPMSMVSTATADRVVLKDDAPDFDRLPTFESKHFIEAESDSKDDAHFRVGWQPSYYWYPPLGYLGYPAYGLDPNAWPPVATERNIPDYTVALREGNQVIASDGKHLGHIERLFLEEDSDKVTHLLVVYGLLPERKLIPVGWVKSVEEARVVLSVPSGIVKGLRPYSP